MIFNFLLFFRGKTLRLFLCGDYEFLTKAYGLTGPNGMSKLI